LHRDFRQFTADSTLGQIAQFDNNSTDQTGYPIVDGVGAIQGYVTRKQIASLLRSGVDQKRPIREFLHPSNSIVFSDEPLRVAADKMAQNNLESLPVVDQSDPQKVVGVVSQEDLFAARVLWFADEKNREKVLSVPSNSITIKMIQNKFSKIRKRKKGSDQSGVADAKVSDKAGDSF
jgi:predicted transcriptional regulator